jgi:hypothetical protein
MIAAADRHPELTFGMMFNQRTNCVYRKLKEMIDGGELGVIKRMSWLITDWYRTQYYYDSGAWRATWNGEGGGVLLNQCPHQLDLLQWLCGLPVSVQARCYEGKWHDIEVEDDVTALLEFENGATANITASRIEQSVDTTVFGNDIVTILLNHLLVHHVCLHKLTDTTCSRNLGGNLVAHLLLTAKDNDFGTLQCQILRNGTAQHTRAARDDYHVVLNVE